MHRPRLSYRQEEVGKELGLEALHEQGACFGVVVWSAAQSRVYAVEPSGPAGEGMFGVQVRHDAVGDGVSTSVMPTLTASCLPGHHTGPFLPAWMAVRHRPCH
jgi:hypothetical protein